MTVKRTMLALLLGLLTVVFSLPVLAEGATEPPAEAAAPESAAESEAVELYVFLWDRCGGCGVDAPGCGECRDTERFHLSIKNQLGSELYDGSVTYRMLNCRYEEFRVQFDEFSERYGVQEEWRNLLPAVFIGRGGSGVYMIGEEAIEDVAEVLHAFEAAEDLAPLQQQIFDRYAERTQAEAGAD